jgi:hypothetical protein
VHWVIPLRKGVPGISGTLVFEKFEVPWILDRDAPEGAGMRTASPGKDSGSYMMGAALAHVMTGCALTTVSVTKAVAVV